MRFAQPHFLWLLLAFPPGLFLFYWWAWRRRQQLMQQFIQARLLPNLTIGLSPARQKLRMGCLIAGVALLILTLARPQWGFHLEEVKQRGLDIVVALDVSKSMLATDVVPNRLVRAKLATLDLLKQARADRLGLVAFAGSAFLQCPLTLDDSIFRQSLDALDVNTISRGGTALAEALDTALTAFKEGDNYKVLVIFTDGEDHDSGALEAAQRAAKDGLRVFTIGVGTAEGELLRIPDANGREDYVRDEQGNVVKSRLNETLLQQIAGATEGGFYLPLRGAKVMEMLYEHGLAPLPKSESREKFMRQYHERFHWPLGLAILLCVLEMLWPEAKRSQSEAGQARSQPGAAVPPGAGPTAVPTVSVRVAVMALMTAVPLLAMASPSGALREYEAGRYDQALKSYEELLQRKGDDPRLRFNAGAAAYRGGLLEEAAKQFDEAAKAPDLKLQEHAYYNLGNTLFRVGEDVPEPQKRMESWDNALKQYDRALKLNTNNADAKFNREFVKRKLEELKQQQQQQQSDRNQDKQDQNDQQPNQQSQQNQPKDQQQDQQKKRQDGQKNEPNQSQQPNQKSEQDSKSDPQEQPKPGQPKDQNQQAQPQPSEQQDGKPPSSEEQQREAQAMAAGRMTPQQAKQLLDSLKGDEQLLPVQQEKRQAAPRSQKDW